MKKILAAALLVVSAGMAVMAQEPAGNMKIMAPNLPAYFDESFNGQVVDVAVDSIVEIRLSENASTGYMWVADRLDTRSFQLVSEDYDLEKGVRIIKVRCLKMKTGDLKFNYVRPWENGSNIIPVKTFRLKLNVVRF
ncbi:MAG: protease inhibitor I42 family protein [Elusimicrobia bacterium]|nr:protease inhibitor I42 family protein [Elusimicrobiota bacterium]